MEDSLPVGLNPDEAAQLRELIERCLTVIRESNERGAQAEAEISALQAETRALLAQLRETLHVEATR
jgi:hypothetical protein